MKREKVEEKYCTGVDGLDHTCAGGFLIYMHLPFMLLGQPMLSDWVVLELM